MSLGEGVEDSVAKFTSLVRARDYRASTRIVMVSLVNVAPQANLCL